MTGTSMGIATFANGAVTTAASVATGVTKSYVVVKLSGFTSDGQGKLIGPNGNPMDSEAFLASLQITTTDANLQAFLGIGASDNLPINVVTQKYGKGIVEYGAKAYGTGANTGGYYNVCSQDGIIYVQVDLELSLIHI